MERLQTPEEVRQVVASYNEDIVLHGSPRLIAPARNGFFVLPQKSVKAAARQSGEKIDWANFPRYVFAGLPEIPDYVVFLGAVQPFCLPRTTGIRVEGASREDGSVTYMINPPEKSDIKRVNPLGFLYILSAEGFGPSPTSWAERVSSEPARILGAYGIYYTALSFGIDDLPHVAIPGVSPEEIAKANEGAVARIGYD